MAKAARKPETKAKEQPSTGRPHVARLLGITDLGHQPSFVFDGGKVAEDAWKFEFTYELVDHEMEDGRPFVVSETLTNKDWEDVKSGKSTTLVARARSMLGDDYKKGVTDVSNLLGSPCMVTVTKNEAGYAKVKGQAAVSGIPFGMEIRELRNEPYFFDMDEPDIDLWENMPEFKQDKIRSAHNFDESPLARLLAEENQYA